MDVRSHTNRQRFKKVFALDKFFPNSLKNRIPVYAHLANPVPEKKDWHILNEIGENYIDVITKINQVVVYSSEMESLKELFESKLGVRLALDQEFDFGQGKIRMMFFRIGGVTIEIVEDTKIDKNSYSGIGWHCDSISLNHKRLSKRGFNISPIRKGRKEGTLVSTIKDAPLSVPTIIIGPDKE